MNVVTEDRFLAPHEVAAIQGHLAWWLAEEDGVDAEWGDYDPFQPTEYGPNEWPESLIGGKPRLVGGGLAARACAVAAMALGIPRTIEDIADLVSPFKVRRLTTIQLEEAHVRFWDGWGERRSWSRRNRGGEAGHCEKVIAEIRGWLAMYDLHLADDPEPIFSEDVLARLLAPNGKLYGRLP